MEKKQNDSKMRLLEQFNHDLHRLILKRESSILKSNSLSLIINEFSAKINSKCKKLKKSSLKLKSLKLSEETQCLPLHQKDLNKIYLRVYSIRNYKRLDSLIKHLLRN